MVQGSGFREPGFRVQGIRAQGLFKGLFKGLGLIHGFVLCFGSPMLAHLCLKSGIECMAKPALQLFTLSTGTGSS